MSGLPDYLVDLYGSYQDVLEDICDTLIVVAEYADLFGDEQDAFHDWAFEHAHEYIDTHGHIDWSEAFNEWITL